MLDSPVKKPASAAGFVSEDDSIGSASDLKDRMNEECDYYYCDRGEVSETISSSVYHAECESVTTHEEEARLEGVHHQDETGSDLKPADSLGNRKTHRGPRPSKSMLRAHAKAIKDIEKRKAIGDRLLGHEYGEKPLLLDDELDSEQEDKNTTKTASQSDTFNKSPSLGSIKQHFSISKPYKNFSTKEPQPPPRSETQEDIFASAPFRRKEETVSQDSIQNLQEIPFHDPLEYPSPPTDMVGEGIVSPPVGFKSQTESSATTFEETVPLGSNLIPGESLQESPLSEFPIYENVTLNEGPPISSEILDHRGIPPPRPNINPFLNPFLDDALTKSQDMENPNLIASTLVANPELPPEIFDSMTLGSYLPPPPPPTSASAPPIETDIFGSTPFGHLTEGVKRDPMPDLLRSTERASSMQCKQSSKCGCFKMTCSQCQLQQYPPPPPSKSIFGAIPPFRSESQLARSAAKSKTLPANMGYIMRSEAAKDDKMSNTPPVFRKPRLAHQVLSESESSSDEESMKTSERKSRDKSKDRLKYKNISEEFEDENIMVLPAKSFKKDEKALRITKKLLHDKKQSKKSEKYLKHEKYDKKLEKTDKKRTQQQETAGISNMSFEDNSVEDVPFQQSPESEIEVASTGGTRFGSLKRGINPFSKLGR